VKVVTVLGTRPEIIRLSVTIPKLRAHCDHVLVHTGQNYDPALSDAFLRDLAIGAPDRYLGVRADSFGQQAAAIIASVEQVFLDERPDRVLVLGDTNSGLSVLPAKRLGIPVYHMEAGNRCYDDRVPEEVNRRVIDHASDVLMPYTERSRANLLREGIASDRIYVTGNPIFEVLQQFRGDIERSSILSRLGLMPRGYFLITLHRAENVDLAARLRNFVDAFARLHTVHGIPCVISTHPRTRSKLEAQRIETGHSHVRWLEPFGFFDFVALERAARCIITDSGTVQEEAAILGIPNVTIRDVTERPETIECGSNMIAGGAPDDIVRAVNVVLAAGTGTAPPEYKATAVSDAVLKIVLGFEGMQAALRPRGWSSRD
jgi:UDP-N-acetylglucosamine 2-epimerase (non-hydrolysing)